MRFLIYSDIGASAGFAFEMQREGSDIIYFIADEGAQNVLKGIVPKVKSLAEGLKFIDKEKDIILFDTVKFGTFADSLRKIGYNVLFGSSFCDRLELDRKYAFNLVKAVGINIPEFNEFNNIKSAIDFLKKHDGKWVIKPEDNKPPSFTGTFDDAKLAIDHLEWLKRSGLYKDGEKFILQEFVEGVEISTQVWFQNGKPLLHCDSTLENKKLLAGGLGPSTGCETSVCWAYRAKEPKIFQQTFYKLLMLFEKANLTGPVDINCIISYENNKPYFLEFTPRIGYNAIIAWMQILTIPLSMFFESLVFEKLEEVPVRKNMFGYAMAVSIPPYPMSTEDEHEYRKSVKKTQGKLIELKDMVNIYPADMMMEDGEFVTAGVDNLILEIGHSADTIEEAAAKAVKTFKSIGLVEKQAKIEDGPDRAKRDYDWLVKAGYVIKDKSPVAMIDPENLVKNDLPDGKKREENPIGVTSEPTLNS